MQKQQPTWRKIVKPLASLKLAVIIIIAMGVMSAWGTIVESKFNDARRAQSLVYHSWYSYLIFVALTINLIAVMADRWPWKRKHIGFLLAHVGIILMLIGSLLTYQFGVDGSLAIDIGKTKSKVSLPGYTDVIVYSGLPSGEYRKIYDKQVDFLSNPPSEENPYTVELPDGKVIIDRFQPYSIGETKVVASELPADGPGIRFQLANARVKQTDWILTGSRPLETAMLGPAQVILARKGLYNYTSGNVLLLEFKKDSDVLDYKVFTEREKKMTSSGTIKAGQMVETGWMGLTFRLLKYLPKAKREFRYTEVARGGDGIMPSVRVRFNDTTQWLSLNSTAKLFTDDAMYYFGYVNRLVELDFGLELVNFEVGRYQGSRRAATYASDVKIVTGKDKSELINISMNEPLYHNGFTFYQASFSENEFGQPTTSVLSVNRDPGRPWKYLGSILIVFGAIHLFYFKRRKKGKA